VAPMSPCLRAFFAASTAASACSSVSSSSAVTHSNASSLSRNASSRSVLAPCGSCLYVFAEAADVRLEPHFLGAVEGSVDAKLQERPWSAKEACLPRYTRNVWYNRCASG